MISTALVGQFFEIGSKAGSQSSRTPGETALCHGCFIAQHRHLGRYKRMFENTEIADGACFLHRAHKNRTSFPGEAKSHTTMALW